MKQTITIKLKPYLQEFLVCKLGDPDISNKNIIGALMSPFLQYVPKDYVYKPMKGDDYISFDLNRINTRLDTRLGIYVSEEGQKDFQRVLYLHFKDIFVSFVDDKIRYTKQIKKCILQFCFDYNMTFDKISYQTLKKMYYREKKRQEEQKQKNKGKSHLNLSLNCPLLFLL